MNCRHTLILLLALSDFLNFLCANCVKYHCFSAGYSLCEILPLFVAILPSVRLVALALLMLSYCMLAQSACRQYAHTQKCIFFSCKSKYRRRKFKRENNNSTSNTQPGKIFNPIRHNGHVRAKSPHPFSCNC